jgi:hypothetical protein
MVTPDARHGFLGFRDGKAGVAYQFRRPLRMSGAEHSQEASQSVGLANLFLLRQGITLLLREPLYLYLYPSIEFPQHHRRTPSVRRFRLTADQWNDQITIAVR